MTHYQHLSITYSHQNRIATVTLQRPELHNALNAQLAEDLQAAFTALKDDETLHGVILTGEGRSFCAGADIQMMKEATTLSEEENLQEALRLADMFHTINTFPCPVVARIQGNAIGGGAGLVATADIAIAAENARFAFSEVKLGLAPAVISPYVIRKIGARNARRFFVTGERFDATQAHTIGLVHTVVKLEQLDEALEQIVNELVSGAPQALRACKTLALSVAAMTAEEARNMTATTIARLRVSQEGQEGLSAYLEKRPPSWRLG